MAQYANKKRTPSTLEVGDEVWLPSENLSLGDGAGNSKLNPKYCGPFTITEKIYEVSVRLTLPQPMKDKQEFVFGSTSVDPMTTLEFEDGHEEHEIEKVLSQRKRSGKIQYFVKWVAYADYENQFLL